MTYDELTDGFDFEFIAKTMNEYADALYISKERSERYNAIIGYALHGKHNGGDGTHVTMNEVLRCIDIIQSTRRLFDIYTCPASLAPDIKSNDMVKVFDHGVIRNETDIIIPFNDDIMNIDILIQTYVVGCMLENGMINRNVAMSCIDVQERATHADNRHNRIFWRYVLNTLDDEMLCMFLKSNLPTLQTFAITSPFVAYPFNNEQRLIIKRYVRNYDKRRTFSYLTGNPFSDR